MNEEYDYLDNDNAQKAGEQLEQKNEVKKEQKELDKSTAAADAAAKVATAVFAGEAGTKVYDAVKQTNIGKAVIQTAGKVVNDAQKKNPMLRRTVNVASAANKVVNNGNEVAGKQIDSENTESSQSINSNNNNSLTSNTSLNSKSLGTSLLNNIFKKNEDSGESTSSLFSFFGKNSKFSMLKLKIYLGIAGACLFVFVFLFIMIFLDTLMSNFLNFTNWNYGSSGSSENIESDSNYSNENSSTISNNNLFSLIGENGINTLTEKINSVGANCTGNGIASKVVALIDGLNGYGYKIPYSNNNNDNSIINRNWGVDSSGNSQGFNDVSFIKWALTAGNVKTSVTKISDYKNLTKKIDLEYSKPGDLIIYRENVYMILQNIGSSVTIAHVTSDGLTYKKYSYDDVKNYDIYDMNLYYSSNCNN